MTGYQTRQRQMLMDFFESHPDQPFTIDEITAALRAKLGPAAPSRSTVYRTVSGLEAEKMLNRNYLADRRRSSYQYLDRNACTSHLHMRCVWCNAFLRLDADVSGAIANLLEENTDMVLDISGTVLAGRCAECDRD